MESSLELNKNGTRTLYVYYQGDRYDEAIRRAEERFGVKDDHTITVICFPMSRKFNDFNKMGRGSISLENGK